MNRVLIVASSEFQTLIKTKAFIISILLVPVLVGASIGFQAFAEKRLDREDRALAVIDHTGVLYAPLAAAASELNRSVDQAAARTGPRFLPTSIDPRGRSADAVKLELSDRVKKKDLFAFVEIPATILDANATAESIGYYTETPSYETLPNWLNRTLTDVIVERRFKQAAIDSALVTKLRRGIALSRLGLLERGPDGAAIQAKPVNMLATFVLPFGLMYLLFIAVMTIAPQLLNAVIEEKTSRISEVLVASVSPVQLMLGKLASVSAVSLVLAFVYLAGGTYAMIHTGMVDAIDLRLYSWFVIYLIAAVLMFGALFLAIGAAASDIKDAQGMMQPLMLLVMLPIFTSPVVLRAPNSGIAAAVSLLPTASPFLMLLRLAMKPGPPAWQVTLSLVLTFATAAALVWAAGRVFRVGLLMQGKTATFGQMVRWLRA
jgi:ABC-2 type transport system permease protein